MMILTLLLFCCIFVGQMECINFKILYRNDPEKEIFLTNKSWSPADVKDYHAVILVHGFLQNGNESWYKSLKYTYFNLKSPTYGFVIKVDWGKDAQKINYLANARINVEKVGYQVADFVTQFINETKVPLSQLEITGFSLGGQVAGVAARKINELLGAKIRRINALDPARPLFEALNDSIRLRQDDAETVVVYHSNSVFGQFINLGTADLYYNNIFLPQPECAKDNNLSLLEKMNLGESFWTKTLSDTILSSCKRALLGGYNKGQFVCDKTKMLIAAACSHRRAILYFEEGLKTGIFNGTSCTSYEEFIKGSCDENEIINFADLLDTDAKGSYFVNTNGNPPYYKPDRSASSFNYLHYINVIILAFVFNYTFLYII